MKQFLKNDPLLSSTTAYQSLEEKKYQAEIELADRYQAFTAELLRLALLGIGVFGFLYKEVFIDFEVATHPDINIDLAKSLASWGIILFGITSIFALIFRYFSSEWVRIYLEGLRYIEANCISKAEKKLKARPWILAVCIFSKAMSASSLAVGAFLSALAFFQLLK